MEEFPTETPASPWSRNAEFWTHIIRDRLDPYRLELTDQAVMRAAGDVRGVRVLDIACGEGYMARAFEAAGAEVFGVDLTPELISAAQASEARPTDESHFEIADMRKLPYGDGAFDLIVANHAINEVDDPDVTFAEWARALKVGGRLVCLMLHPCFFKWGGEEADYFEPHSVGEKPYTVSGITSPAVAVAHTAPLETYINGFLAAGLRLDQLSEVRPTAEQVAKSDWWKSRSKKPKFLLLTGTRT